MVVQDYYSFGEVVSVCSWLYLLKSHWTTLGHVHGSHSKDKSTLGNAVQCLLIIEVIGDETRCRSHGKPDSSRSGATPANWVE